MAFPSTYPFVNLIKLLDTNEGKWVEGKPSGITLHTSADRDINRVINWLNQKKLGYHILIDRNGDVIQTCSFSLMANHAGKALWNGLSPNKTHLSICLVSWGKLIKGSEKFYAWNGEEINIKEINIFTSPNGQNEYFDSATNDQRNKLISILRWFMAQGIKPENVCGHHECCLPLGRKTDPGWAIDCSMDDFRKKLYLENLDISWDRY